jgi:ABC-type multidrug transport system fused ATPase/permease subunit
VLQLASFTRASICRFSSALSIHAANNSSTQKIREQYLAAVLRQNIAFFDKLGAGEITTRITADTNLIQDGISEKIGLTLTAIATFITAFVIGFVKYWRLTLILTSTIFTICTIMGGGSRFIVKYVLQSIYTAQSDLLPASVDTKLCIVVSAAS